jgi:hypothetical protein
MASNEGVCVSVRLKPDLWSRLRREAEVQRDAGGRASVRAIILRVLEQKFSADAAGK